MVNHLRKMGLYSVIFLLLISIVLVGCGKKEEQANNNVQSEANAELIELGKKTAMTSCIGCHGRDLTGDMGPNLHTITLTKEEIIDVLIKGKGSMPPVTANGKEEAVAAYLLSLRK